MGQERGVRALRTVYTAKSVQDYTTVTDHEEDLVFIPATDKIQGTTNGASAYHLAQISRYIASEQRGISCLRGPIRTIISLHSVKGLNAKARTSIDKHLGVPMFRSGHLGFCEPQGAAHACNFRGFGIRKALIQSHTKLGISSVSDQKPVTRSQEPQ